MRRSPEAGASQANSLFQILRYCFIGWLFITRRARLARAARELIRRLDVGYRQERADLPRCSPRGLRVTPSIRLARASELAVTIKDGRELVTRCEGT